MRHDARTDARTAPPPIRCDVTMGDMDGLQIVKAIRADPALAHIPFIMMMANPSEGKVAEAKGAGVTGRLAKPFDMNMAEETIKAVTNH